MSAKFETEEKACSIHDTVKHLYLAAIFIWRSWR